MTLKEFLKVSSEEYHVKPMRETFLRGLSVCAVIAFLASLLISLALEDHSCRKEITREINSKIAENNEYLLSVTQTADLFKKANINNAEIIALSAIQLLSKNPSMLESSHLEELAHKLQFSSIVVLGTDGIVDASWPENIVGSNVRENGDLSYLTEILDMPISRTAPRVVFRLDTDDYTASSIEVSANRSDAKGVVFIKIRDLFNMTSEQVEALTKPLNANIGHNGRLCFFPRSRESAIQSPNVSGFNQDLPGDFPALDSLPDNETTIKLFNERFHLVYSQRTPFGIFVGWVPYRDLFHTKIMELSLVCFCNFIVLLAIFSLVSFFIQKLFVESIYAVNKSLNKITEGNLNEKVDVKASKEFVELSDGVNTTVDSLKEAANEVKRRTDEEMTLAGKIQSASLPRLEKIYTRHQIFDVYAEARLLAGVGGDMYDFFFVGDFNVFFYIADVAGRGVAASLVMMKTMALVKNFALLGHDLETVVTLVNRYLAESSGTPFVSGLFFTLNLETCEFKYIDAGHIPPIYRKRGQSFRLSEPRRQLVLGLDPNLTYSSDLIQFEPGDDLIIYTDGVLGTGNTTLNDFFETSQTLETLNSLQEGMSSQEYVKSFLAKVLNNPEEAHPDDVAVLCFRFLSRKTEKNRRSENNPDASVPEYPEDAIKSSLRSPL